jgi:hypothetical protein
VSEHARKKSLRAVVALALLGIAVIVATAAAVAIVWKVEEVQDHDRAIAIRGLVHDELRIVARVLDQDPPATDDATRALDATEGFLTELDAIAERHASRLDNPVLAASRDSLRGEVAGARARIARIRKDAVALATLEEIVQRRDLARFDEAQNLIFGIGFAPSWASTRVERLAAVWDREIVLILRTAKDARGRGDKAAERQALLQALAARPLDSRMVIQAEERLAELGGGDKK